MSAYDFTAAGEFLDGIEATPEGLRSEVWAAWCNLSDIETKRNSRIVASVRETLLTCADLLERITPAHPSCPRALS